MKLPIYVVVHEDTHEYVKAFATLWAANTYIAITLSGAGYAVIEDTLGAWHND